jgi:pimeloyl-ACP methyl ester carboxylesterase
MTIRSVGRVALGQPFALRVSDDGPEGAPLALLLHGFPQHSGMWTPTLAGLHELGLRTRTVDQRGYSPLPQPSQIDSYQVEHLVADAVAVLDDAGADQAVVIGHDWGALVGWALAGHYPDRVRGLVALSVPHPRAFGWAIKHDPQQQELSRYFGLLRDPKAERVLLANDAAVLRRFFEGGSVSTEQVDGYLAPLRDPDQLRGALAWYRAMAGPELAAVPDVAVPTVYVSAGHDLGVGPVAAERCADFVTGRYQHVDLPEATHWIVDEQPDVVVRAARSLLA